MYKLYSVLTSLVLSVVTAPRTLHPTPFKSCLFFLASVFLLLPLLPSTFFVQSAKALSSAILISSHNVTIDKNWSLTFVRFLVCFLLLLLFSLIFSNVKYFLLWIWSHFFTFNIFLLFFSTDILFKHHFHFLFASSSLHKNTKKYSQQLNLQYYKINITDSKT